MIVFFLTGHFFPQHLSLTSICNVCAHSSLQYFPTFPQFLACLAGHVVLTRGCNHIRHLTSSLNVRDEVCAPPPKMLVWVLFLYTTALSTELQQLNIFKVPLTLLSSSFTQMKIFDRPCNHAQRCP